MPIHPIGIIARKGSLGSPYSISDYRGINPEYGTRSDFARLIQKAHNTGLKV
jgi:cyclomaltodextrinase / maltogenic alpha-amylase / neopullulanase